MVELLRADEVVAGDAERGEFAAQVRRGGTLVTVRSEDSLASLTLIAKAQGSPALLILGSLSLGFALFNVIGGYMVTDRMLAMFSRKKSGGGR